MKNYAVRLIKGDDLKKSIITFAEENKIVSGVITCGVGCLSEANIRLATGNTTLQRKEPYEIVSLMGTISKDGVHIHISLSDINGTTIGGHLKDGCIVNTTCELCIQTLEEYTFKREYDETTGYKELVIMKK